VKATVSAERKQYEYVAVVEMANGHIRYEDVTAPGIKQAYVNASQLLRTGECMRGVHPVE